MERSLDIRKFELHLTERVGLLIDIVRNGVIPGQLDTLERAHAKGRIAELLAMIEFIQNHGKR